MSAFICSDKHIAVVARYIAGEFGLSEDNVFKTLKRENYRSVNYRYNEKERPSYPKMETIDVPELPQVDILKLCNSLDYQSCEHPGWKGSSARVLLNAGMGRLWGLLSSSLQIPFYETAKWSI